MRNESNNTSSLPIGTAIKVFRIRLGLNAVQLAAKAEMSHAYLCNIEQDNREPRFFMFEKICNALGFPMSDIISEAEIIKQIREDA